MTVHVILDPCEVYHPPDRLRWLRFVLLVIAIVTLSYVGYGYLDAVIYEARADRIFEQPVAVSPGSTIVQRATPLSLVGRIEIARLNVKAVVKEGVDNGTLRRAVGHVPGTALPGETGNVAFAAHRDSFFRGLRDVRKDDVIQVETLNRKYEYVVDSFRIVTPKEVQVLAPTRDNVLTLVTCYPFNFIGHAPKRFIVRARQVAVSQREPRGS